uniref:Reticulon-like protein n=1 Tax=Chlamydomonas leiostraca TaxID=1034604 RepID=A0A7S0RQ73_9CHLO|mmetsp:Transcript_28764/g.73245  ORF Transcript_28764/g.73245 Transcript_28764/m.73245 type:complete len:371 (+) Transcript_28764:107-1219(+)
MVEGSPVSSPAAKGSTFGAMVSDLASSPKQAASAASSVTKQAVDAIESAVDSSTKGFGSPAPPSPLDHSAKQLDFDLKQGEKPVPATPATPVLPNSTKPSSGEDEEGEVDYNAFIRDTLLWTHRVRSGLYLLSGVAVILVAHRAATSRLTLVTGVCYAALAQLALNFVRALSAPALQARCTWGDSAWTYGAIHYFGSALKAAAAVHDAHCMGSDPAKTLRIGALLWAVSLGARTLSTTHLALALYVAAFTLPKAYTMFRSKIDGVTGKAFGQAKAQFDKLDVRARAAAVVLPLLLAGYALSRLDLAIALFLLAVYGRCWLTPSGVAALENRVVKPLTATTTKVGGTVSRLVGQAAAKYELTPTPTKAKRE